MGRPVTIDELIALNTEIVILTRAGVPLEAPLLAGGVVSPKRWQWLSHQLGKKLESGVPLTRALEELGSEVPGPYRAVVEAGLKAGRLPAALEGVSRYARAYAELRRQVGLAALSPILVLIFAYAMFVVSLFWLVPRLKQSFDSLGISDGGTLRTLDWFAQTLGLWGLILPALVVLGLVWWNWISTARQFGQMRGLACLPWLGGVLASWRAANFSGWLALLIEHQVPLDEGIVLAAEATGDPRLMHSSREVASNIRQGMPLSQALDQGGQAIHPWVRWEIAAVRDEQRLAEGLTRSSEAFTRQAERKAELIRLILPAVLMIILGGVAATLCVLSVYLPWSQLLYGLGTQT